MEQYPEKYEEEEFLVYVDLDAMPFEGWDFQNHDLKILGIDSDNPIMQINGKLFKGTYELSMGTLMFFEKDESPPSLDPLFDLHPDFLHKYSCKTNKVLRMERIFVENVPKEETVRQGEEQNSETERKHIEVNMSYVDALNLLLPPRRHYPPRETTPNENYIPKARKEDREDAEEAEEMEFADESC